MDKYRRELNQDFADQIMDLIEDDCERSFSESSSDDSNMDGQLIYLYVWLGNETGHKTLQGTTKDKPSVLARQFAQKYNLTMNQQIELQIMVAKKIKDHKSLYI